MDKFEKLKELKALLDNGVLNQDEFDKLKNEMLFSEDKINSNLSVDSITFTKAGSHKNRINESGKSNSERNVFEEIAIKNNQKINYKIPQKNNNNLIYFAVFIGVILFFFFQNNNNVVNDSNQNSSQDNTTKSSSDSYIESSSTICKICGRNFTGDGYDKIDGVWQRNTNMQTELCSQNCAMVEDQRQNQKYNDILVKHGYEPIDDSQSSSSNHAQPNSNGFFTGSDGQLHQASPCGNCHHTGYVEMGDGMQVCPMCDGKGEKIY
jgi:5-methylcytosine-specific restriction endonuclease McrA